MRRLAVSVSLLLACASKPVLAPPSVPAESVQRSSSPPRVIVLVRHAEKTSEDSDAALSPTGHARAACLAAVVADLGVTHVFHTPLQRTRDTVAAIAARHSLVPTVIAPGDDAAWLQALHRLPAGAVAIVAGHSNSIPALVERLGAGTVTIDHAAYDWMFVVVLPEHGDALLLRTHYCPASHGDAALEKSSPPP